MGVYTKADELRDQALEHVKEATKLISEVILNECDGYDEYRDSYKLILDEVFTELRDIKRKIEFK